MVIIDHNRCAYCGGCVSICPVEALSLDETILAVSEDCIDCGDCVSACPVGALQAAGMEPLLSPAQFKREYDVIVVGAGPGGSTAARVAALAGLSVLLIEKRQEIGSPVRCAEGVGHDALIHFIEPDIHWIAAEVTRAEIIAIEGEKKRAFSASGGLGYILERRIFDRVLAERAALAGAEIKVKTAVTGVLMENGRVHGVKIRTADFLSGSGDLEVEARVVIAADGVEAQVGRWAGLDLHLPLADTMVCAQYLLAGIEIDPTCNSYTIGEEVAPGGYAWVFPKGEGKANVGLGVQANLWEQAYARIPTAQKNIAQPETIVCALTRFIEATPCLARGYPVSLIAGNVPAAPTPSRLVKDGFMLVGDAARQVDPLTGGGIINAMTAGQIAAQVAIEAVTSNETSAGFLSRYEQQWDQSLGRKNRRNSRLRERFAPGQRTGEGFLRAFALATSG